MRSAPAQGAAPREPITIAIVEDHSFLSAMLRLVCERDLNCRVIAVASGGIPGLQLIQADPPDLAIVDLSLPDMDGIDLAAAILKTAPPAKVLVFSSKRDAVTLHRVRELGVHGFLHKQDPDVPSLRTAIETIAAGGRYFSEIFQETIAQLDRDPAAFHKILSDREQALMSHIGEGKNDEEIGLVCGITAATVQAHRRNMMRKLGIHSTYKLMRYAIEQGFTNWEQVNGEPLNRL